MKKTTLLLLFFSMLAMLSAQQSSQLYRTDRMTDREDPIPLQPEWAPSSTVWLQATLRATG